MHCKIKMNRRNRSAVWQHFSKTSEFSAKCLICKNEFKCRNNTSNLRDHLKRRHFTISQQTDNTEIMNVDDPSENSQCDHHQPSTSTSVSCAVFPGQSATSSVPSVVTPGCSDGSLTSKRASQQLTLQKSFKFGELPREKIKKLDLLVAKMVAEDLQPLSIVENKGFIKLLNELEPRYTMPSRRHLIRTILPGIYESSKEAIQKNLHLTSYVSLTTDIWTSLNTTSFITVTAHFFNSEHILQSNVLATTELVTNHTAIYLGNVLKRILEEWHIMDKVVACVTDSGANIKAAVNILGIPHLPCIAHLLNLVVQNAVTNTQNFDSLLKACRTLVTYFKSSVAAVDKLRSIEAQMGVTEYKLKKDVTRWNSIYYMLERLLQVKEALSAALPSLPSSPSPLTADQWAVIEDSVAVLKPLELLTTELSADKYPTISKVIPLVRGIQMSLKNKERQTTLGTDLKNNIIQEISRRLGQVEKMDIPASATFLDPRFKKAGFGNEVNAELSQKHLTSELSVLCERHTATEDQTAHLATSSTDNIWGFLEDKVAQYKCRTNPTSNANIML